MHRTLRIGRFGPLTVNLHYTWLLAVVLGLWWLALLWLPESFPGRNDALYWIAAIGVMLLFGLSVVLHELVHTLVAGGGKRNITLYPFGSDAPFRFTDVSSNPVRVVLAALAGPVFNLALGAALLALGAALNDAGSLAAGVKAFATSLGWLNLLLGLVNLLPGIPFDMGWALTGAIYWFTGDRDAALRITRTVGELLALVLTLLAAWRGLADEDWLGALALIMVAWTAREAIEASKHRQLLRSALYELTASDVMDSLPPGDAVHETDSVAAMVKKHPRSAPDSPLPVLDEHEDLVGIVTLSETDAYLQGTWPSTPVRALMRQPGEMHALDPSTPLSEVIALVEQQPGSPIEQPDIPVLSNGKLVGSVDPSELEAFEEIDLQLGTEDSVQTLEAPTKKRARLGTLLAALIIIAAMAIWGTAAFRSNPYSTRGLGQIAGPLVTFSQFFPPDGTSIGPENRRISVDVIGARAVISALISLDGRFLPTNLSGSSPLQQTASIETEELAPGSHNVLIVASTVGGPVETAQWEFWVGDRVTPTASPLVTPEPFSVIWYVPPVGSKILAGAAGVPVGLEVRSSKPPISATVWYDDQPIAVSLMPTEGVPGRYTVSGSLPGVEAGDHHMRVQIARSDPSQGEYTTEWTITALEPDADNAYFKETGYFVSQPFLKYWQDHGGLAIFGYPISDRLRETDKETGETYIAQYFERARFELHPANSKEVVLGRLGALLHAPEPAAAPLPGAQYFPQTGHNLSGPFLARWNDFGALALFGYPITEELTETNPADGKEYKVQYFERARFELHPELANTPFEVQLGQLGAQLYAQDSNRR